MERELMDRVYLVKWFSYGGSIPYRQENTIAFIELDKAIVFKTKLKEAASFLNMDMLAIRIEEQKCEGWVLMREND